MSRMNAAWSNSEQWQEAVPEIFKQPMTIAFGGAVLAHLMFFLGLPAVVGKETTPDVQPVATTVLTPEEMAQVPQDTLQPQILPPGTLPGMSGLLNPTPNGPSLTTPLPSISGDTPIGTGSGISSGFNFGGSYTPPDNRVTVSSRSDSNTTQPDEKAREKANREAKQDKEVEKIEQKAPTELPATGDKSITPSAMPPETPKGQTNPPQGQPSPTMPVSPSPVPAPPQMARVDSPEGRRETFQRSFNATNTKLTGDAGGLIMLRWIGNSPIRQRILERDKEMRYEDKKKKSTPEKKEPIEYPKQIGNEPMVVIPDYKQKFESGYGRAVVGFVVDGEGQLMEEPNIIQSTGYKNSLDFVVIEHIKKLNKDRTLPKSGKEEYHMWEIPIAPPAPKTTA